MNENDIGKIIVDAAVKIHKDLGPGLLETVYEIILADQLQKRGLKIERQVTIPIEYQGIKFEQGFKADMLVENIVIIELKSVEFLSNAHKKQVLTYLRLAKKKLGYLLNFGEALMKDGIVRIINGYID